MITAIASGWMMRSWASRRASSAAAVAVASSGYPMAIRSAMVFLPLALSLFPAAGAAPGLVLAEGGDEDRLDGVETVLGLVEHDASPRLEYLAGHLQTGGHAGVLHHLPPDHGLHVVEGRQAVHELDRRVPGLL